MRLRLIFGLRSNLRKKKKVHVKWYCYDIVIRPCALHNSAVCKTLMLFMKHWFYICREDQVWYRFLLSLACRERRINEAVLRKRRRFLITANTCIARWRILLTIRLLFFSIFQLLPAMVASFYDSNIPKWDVKQYTVWLN